MDANILHRIKQEPVDYDEAPELTCVTCQQDFSGNSFKQKYAPLGGGDLLVGDANGNQGNESPLLPRVDQESSGGGQSNVCSKADHREAASSVTVSSGLRRSSRQRYSVQRLSPQRKEKTSTNLQRQSPRAQSVSSPRSTFSSVQRRHTSRATESIVPNQMLVEGRLGEIQTSDIISDESDLFKRRFRKVRYQETLLSCSRILPSNMAERVTISQMQRWLSLLPPFPLSDAPARDYGSYSQESMSYSWQYAEYSNVDSLQGHLEKRTGHWSVMVYLFRSSTNIY